ncbi:MepB family protein [Leptospira mtsangambouensis]|uniref:MepB family protein n=1 Tax=Leptospira mtsangambouensis TaxID=2484912 RepID=UPI001EE9E5A0|nr:MepB family protein [Leptospira mtsangambouensis]MCG6141381.1 MepB family protein [Leptospira mtsangambouensis]
MNQKPHLKKTLSAFLKNAHKTLFDPLKLIITNVFLEEESAEYNACNFQCNGKKITFRSAKVTPKKIGQFVTLWKRSQKGPIEPYQYKDKMDLYIIETQYKNHIGYFIFTKEILNEKGILFGKYEGKRGFRVYPTWDQPNNKQGMSTQKWQLPYFLDRSEDKNDLDVLRSHLEIFIK